MNNTIEIQAFDNDMDIFNQLAILEKNQENIASISHSSNILNPKALQQNKNEILQKVRNI